MAFAAGTRVQGRAFAPLPVAAEADAPQRGEPGSGQPKFSTRQGIIFFALAAVVITGGIVGVSVAMSSNDSGYARSHGAVGISDTTSPVGHTNGTDTGDDHTTDYGAGTAMVIVVLGFLLIGVTLATPWFLDDAYYTPLNRRTQQVVLVRADTPIVQGGKAAPAAAHAVTPGGTLVATPDLSCLGNRYASHGGAETGEYV